MLPLPILIGSSKVSVNEVLTSMLVASLLGVNAVDFGAVLSSDTIPGSIKMPFTSKLSVWPCTQIPSNSLLLLTL